jgi:trimeric autotransporter adhesin
MRKLRASYIASVCLLMLVMMLVLLVSTPARAQVFNIQTAAGTTWTGDGGPAFQVLLRQPSGIAADANGNVYVSEIDGQRVRKISPDGTVVTVTGTGVRGFSGDGGPAISARLNSPYGLALDAAGNLYIADLGNARVRKVTPDGIISTVVGGGDVPPTLDNIGTAATGFALAAPRNVAIDAADGSLYVADFTGHRVYHVDTDGNLNIVAGTGTPGYSGDGGPAVDATLAYPAGLAIDSSAAVYVSDSQNGVVRKIQNGIISTIPQMAQATIFTPTGLTLDSSGELEVVDAANEHMIRLPHSGNPSLMTIGATDVASSANGFLYTTDTRNGVVRRVSQQGDVLTLAGGGDTARGDQGPATAALLNRPSGVAADSAGNIYIADRNNHRIRKVDTDGKIQTIAGIGMSGNTGDGGPAILASLNQPSALAMNAVGDIYISDTGNHRVRVITASGDMNTLVGSGVAGFSGDGGPALTAQLNSPSGIAIDPAGIIYIADTGNNRIRSVIPDGTIATIASDLKGPRGLALDSLGYLYFTEETGKRVRRLDPITGDVVNIAPGSWSAPRGITVTSTNQLFVADTGHQQILTIDRKGRALAVAGTGSLGFSGDGGAALRAELGYPSNVAVAASGDLLIADLDNDRIRRLILQPEQSTLALWNAASQRPSAVAPNMLVELRNSGLLATDVADTVVLFNSIPVPIFSMDDTRILLQTPAEIVSAASVEVLVVNEGSIVAQRSFTGAPAAPALFTTDPGQASVTNADGSANSPSSPAPRGSLVSMLGTGLGLGDLPVSVTVNGVPAEISAVSTLPDFPGIFRIIAKIPMGIPAGPAEVLVTVGENTSPAGVNVSLR